MIPAHDALQRLREGNQRHGSDVLERLAGEGLIIVGAEYSLETRIVEFL
jgi:hypothetical protein